jgi:hypothetical protein
LEILHDRFGRAGPGAIDCLRFRGLVRPAYFARGAEDDDRPFEDNRVCIPAVGRTTQSPRATASPARTGRRLSIAIDTQVAFCVVPPEMTKTQVLGVLANLMPVQESVDDVRKIVDADHFVKLTLVTGIEIWMRATSIGWMMEKYPGLEDPRSKCVVSLSLGRGSPTPVREDLETVKKLVEAARPTEH